MATWECPICGECWVDTRKDEKVECPECGNKDCNCIDIAF